MFERILDQNINLWNPLQPQNVSSGKHELASFRLLDAILLTIFITNSVQE